MTPPTWTAVAQVDGVGVPPEDPDALVFGLVVAAAILLVGYVLGSWLQGVAVRLGRRSRLDDIVDETPFSVLFGDSEDAASKAFGYLVQLYVLLIALFAAFTYVGAFAQLTAWLREAVTYAPVFVAGLLILILGAFLAERIATSVGESATAETTGFPEVFEEVTKALLYFVAVVIGLDTIGVSVGILYAFGETLALAVGLALALAVGIAFGWGAKDYVAENIASWHEETGERSASD